MSIFLKLGLAGMMLVASAGPAAAPPQSDPKAAQILEQSKAASGGAAWDRLEGSYEEGVHNGRPYRTWMDFRAYGRRVEGQAGASRMAMGYDGSIAWRRIGDELKVLNDQAALSEARISAFVSNNSFFFPERFAASTKYVRRARDGAREYDVVETKPEGARAVRLWFDGSTHLLARIEDFAGTPALTVTISDYRPVQGVLVAFKGEVTDASGKVIDRGTVNKVVHGPVSRQMFEAEGKAE
jgi:hypothetical protein